MGNANIVTVLSLSALLAHSAMGQETDLANKISVELNAVETRAGSCTLTFLVTNGFTKSIDKAIYETVLFDKSGQVNRLTLFDFGILPPARPRVRQFSVPELNCDQLGRILFNGVSTCTGEGINAADCDAAFRPSTRTDIEVLG